MLDNYESFFFFKVIRHMSIKGLPSLFVTACSVLLKMTEKFGEETDTSSGYFRTIPLTFRWKVD